MTYALIEIADAAGRHAACRQPPVRSSVCMIALDQMGGGVSMPPGSPHCWLLAIRF